MRFKDVHNRLLVWRVLWQINLVRILMLRPPLWRLPSGVPGEEDCCPIYKGLPGGLRVRGVTREMIAVGSPTRARYVALILGAAVIDNKDRGVGFEPTEAMKGFIKLFDAEQLPRLIDWPNVDRSDRATSDWAKWDDDVDALIRRMNEQYEDYLDQQPTVTHTLRLIAAERRRFEDPDVMAVVYGGGGSGGIDGGSNGPPLPVPEPVDDEASDMRQLVGASA